MYQQLESVHAELKSLRDVRGAHDGQSRIARIVAAFDQTAAAISDATQQASDEYARNDLRMLYSGMLAARRLVQQLQELPGAGVPAMQ